jgi:hormone-sensitive lipase
MSKLEVADIALEGAIKADPNDLFYISPLNEKWALLDKCSRVVKYNTPEFTKAYQELERILLVGAAACYQGMANARSPFLGSLNTFFNVAYYQVFKNKGKMQGELLLAKPEPAGATEFWNFLECKYVKPLLMFTMTSAKVNRKIYIPKLLQPLTLDNIDTPLDLTTPLPSIVNKEFINIKPKPIPESLVPVRIICKESLPYEGNSRTAMKFDRVIIHFHGGGFVAMSTRSHQIYLRKWARHTNTVIFTVEYRLAPQYKYPAGLDDAWQAYYWLITEGEKQLGVKMKYVILAGDSAGGNLALAVTLRCIRTQFRIPDGLLLAYPGNYFLNF